MKQVQKDNVSHQDWAIVWHPPRTPLEDSVVVIPWHQFEKYLLNDNGTTPPIENNEVKWAAQKAVDGVKGLLKALRKYEGE